jgi:hypothetical protein
MAINILNPFGWLSDVAQKRLWFGSLVISAVSLSAIKMLDESLVNDYAPLGIISSFLPTHCLSRLAAFT